MELTQVQKQKIIEGLRGWIASQGLSQAKAAKKLGISAAQLNRILNGEKSRVLADDKFIAIATKLQISLNDGFEWRAVKTKTFRFIWTQLEVCQRESLSLILSDRADIGKTFTAKQYARAHREVAYIDCSLYKTKDAFVRKIAQEFGLDSKGRLRDVEDRLIWYLKNMAEHPLIILDEAGDLESKAFAEIKAMWNGAEYRVGWYMMGADGLQEKLNRALQNKKVGYAEIFSRFGTKYQKAVPEGEEYKSYMREEIINIAKANGANDRQAKEIYARSGGSLRRVYIEIRRLRVLGEIG